jgi:tubulin epsilon
MKCIESKKKKNYLIFETVFSLFKIYQQMREIVSIHVGQCGNQVGSAFWNLLLLEHEQTPDNDPALTSFFYFQQGKKRGAKEMKARALLIDMECGPLNETMRSSLGSLFDETQYIMDVSGSGNNFAQGYCHYGPTYHEKFLQGLASNLEKCDSLQGFSLTHSLGGGTGSGVGTYVLHLLADEFPKATRFSTCVYPSDENDVITAPYNILLATRELINSADCVFPLNNSSLFAFHQLENPQNSKEEDTTAYLRKRSKGYEGVNNIAARVLCNLTSSSRFHGEMNVDINEIYTNLVPFTKMHFLTTSMNVRYPLTTQQRLRTDSSRNALQRAFGDIMGTRGQLSGGSVLLQQQMRSHQASKMTLASAFLARGKVVLSDFINCVEHAQKSMSFPDWNSEACKVTE